MQRSRLCDVGVHEESTGDCGSDGKRDKAKSKKKKKGHNAKEGAKKKKKATKKKKAKSSKKDL